MNIISYSLWGSGPIYNIGAIRNADLAKEFYPNWACVYYCFDSVPQETIKELNSRSNCIVRKVEGEGNRKSAIDRFFPVEEQGVERVICRDTDSRLSPREVSAVNEWIREDTDVHVMRDHPYHSVPILAGMWGAKGGRLQGLSDAAKAFVSSLPEQYKFQDQDFLTKWLWTKINNRHLTMTVHDPIFSGKQFPLSIRGEKNNGVWFVGQVFDEHEHYNSQGDVDIVMRTGL